MADKDFRVKRGIHVGTDAYISNSITSVNSISFVTNANVDPTLGLLTWNETYQTLDLGLSDSVSVHLGQDSYYYVTNQSGSTITKGTAVRAVGTLGNGGTILVSPAVANGSIESKFFIGLAAADIADGDSGYVVEFGKLRQANTLAFSAGDVLYLDTALPGALSNTLPVAPNNKVTVAIVINRSENQGVLFVRPTFDDRVGDLRDVHLTSISNGQSLVWVSSNSRFENQTVSGGGASLNVALANSSNIATNVVAGVSTLLFDTDSGLDIVNLGGGNVKVQLNSTFKTWEVDGQESLIAEGLDNVRFVAGDGIAITTNALASPKSIEFAWNANAWVNANDYTTYLQAQSNDGATLATARGNDHSTLLEARSNDYTTFTTLTANIYNTYTTLSANPSNTNIYAGNVNLANTTVFIQAGDGVVLQSNTTSKTLTIATSMSNVTSQTIAISGTSNVFSLTKSAANANMILVMYNGLVQDPARYTIVDSTLTLLNTAPLVAGANVEVRYFDFFSLPGASSGGGESYSFQGSVSGYTSGGNSTTNIIDKFSFSSAGNATDVGDLTQARPELAGQSSSTSGYSSGGAPGPLNTIDKFPFASNANATDVGDLTQSRNAPAGQSSSSSGYTSGGEGNINTIDKFSFAANGNASDVGNLTRVASFPAGQSSSTHGYTTGNQSPAATNVIDKFPFAADGNASDVGDLTVSRGRATGQSSASSGYSSGGHPAFNTIDKFPFATDGNASDVGDLTVGRYGPAGQSSTASGYTSGGSNPFRNQIDKFPFASNANATDVGDLTQARAYPAGQQV